MRMLTMKKIIVIPDSFKGTFSSVEVCRIIKEEFTKYFSSGDIIAIPVADGGEGTVECFRRLKDASAFTVETTGPLMEKTEASYVVYRNTAVIELASAAGFSLAKGKSSPLKTTTYGVGTIIRDAVSRGCTRIILGLGGSCTNDAGAGIAAALGTVFFDSSGCAFIPVGETLSQVKNIDTSETERLLSGVEVMGMCDTASPMYGPEGAAFVFAPQKGASPEEVKLLDRQLLSFSETVKKCLGRDVSRLPGGGAAGAAGAGIAAFLSAELRKGIDTILDLISFDDLLDQCSFVVTGEGKFDCQSLGGKAVSGISAGAKKKGVPAIVIAGQYDREIKNLSSYGIEAVFEAGKFDPNQPPDQIRRTCTASLRRAAEDAGLFLYRRLSGSLTVKPSSDQ